MDGEKTKEGNRTVLIVLTIASVVGFFALSCCLGLGYLGYRTVDDTDKTYYAECEDLEDNIACQNCCQDFGHEGHVHGRWINEDDKVCGCI